MSTRPSPFVRRTLATCVAGVALSALAGCASPAAQANSEGMDANLPPAVIAVMGDDAADLRGVRLEDQQSAYAVLSADRTGAGESERCLMVAAPESTTAVPIDLGPRGSEDLAVGMSCLLQGHLDQGLLLWSELQIETTRIRAIAIPAELQGHKVTPRFSGNEPQVDVYATDRVVVLTGESLPDEISLDCDCAVARTFSF